MRVAFTLIGGSEWTGGINYLENLLSALSEHTDCGIQPVLFTGTDNVASNIDRLLPYLTEPPIHSTVWNADRAMRAARFALGLVFQRDFLAEREFKSAGIDVVFQHGAWYGHYFGLPTLAWIADFQHRRLPGMFSAGNYLWREAGYRALSHTATRIMVSSLDAKNDCERYLPKSIGRIDAVPFSAKIGEFASLDELENIRLTYSLPEKFFFLPNQFWRHKNHDNLIKALVKIRESGRNVIVISSGLLKDHRHPGYPQQVLDSVAKHNLEDVFVYLGLIPFEHIQPLMRLSTAVINPSFFEGWSTTVEEAKAVGAPMILSDLPIHREQALDIATFFDPSNPLSIASALLEQWDTSTPGPRPEQEKQALINNHVARARFASKFGESASLCIRTHRH